MKSAFFALALAGSAVAQNLSGEPVCASACLISAISKAGCAPSDVGCQCGPTQSAIASLVAPCLLSSCAGSALLQAESAGLALCSLYSKTAGTPATASATATTTASTGTGSGSSSATSTSSGTVATETTKTTTSTRASGNSTVTTVSKTSTKGTTTGTGTGTGTGAGATTTSSSSTAGAATLGAGVLAAFVGLIAAL